MERENEGDAETAIHRRRPISSTHTVKLETDAETYGDIPETEPLMAGKDSSTVMRWAKCYAIYVLILLLIAYLLNQLDRYALAVVTQPMSQDIHYGDQSCLYGDGVDPATSPIECIKITEKDKCTEANVGNDTNPCKWDYNGNGFQYQVLVGPVFILVYTFMGIPLSYAADKTNRKNLLAICLIFWSIMTLLTGFAQEYWHLVILRFGLGIGQAGCTPFAASIITDYFSDSTRGTALGVYNWGIYVGYSMAYAVGNFITQANINDQGWRWVFWICGIPGILHGILIFVSLKEPERKKSFKEGTPEKKLNGHPVPLTCWEKTKVVAKPFLSPSLLIICFAGSVRNGAGYVWGYNTQPYFNTYYPAVNVGFWMSWVPLVSGSIGVVFGGFISDRVVKRSGPVARIWVIVISLLIAAPFAALTLLVDPPWAFVCQIPTYIFGEMWVSVTLAVIVDLVPSSIRTAVIAVYFFIITNIGGNMPLLVAPITDVSSLRVALLILYPGMYVAGSLFYVVSLVVLKRDIRKVQEKEAMGKEPLLDDDGNEEEEAKSKPETDKQKTLYGTLPVDNQ